MIWYFQKSLRPSVTVEMEQCGRELNSFKKLLKKAVDKEAKATLQPRSYACETNQHCFRGSRPPIAKANTHGKLIKNPKVEKPKSKSQKSKALAPQYLDGARSPRKLRRRRRKTITKIEGIVMPKKAPQRPLELITPTPTIVRRRGTAPTAATPTRLSITIVTK